MNRYPPVTYVIHRLIESLVQPETVNSVQCPWTDPEVWRILIREQQNRARKTQLSLQQVLFLSGPDSGLWPLNPADLGGEVHIPYEGATPGDLFILPYWSNFRAERAQGSGSLRRATWGKQCHFVLSAQDYGELSSAYRTKFDEWTLYESRLPYVRYEWGWSLADDASYQWIPSYHLAVPRLSTYLNAHECDGGSSKKQSE